MRQASLQVESLAQSFGPLKALNEVALEVFEGELFGLVGPDGAGKTTCLRCLAGVLDAEAGQGRILGASFPHDIEQAKARLGYMPQRFGLYADLSVTENLNFYAEIHRVSRRERAERLGQLLDFVNLSPFRRRQAGRLSGGMKQKLGLACALIHRPRLLLLDEPTSGVDPVSRREFWALLTGLLSEGVSVVVATTYMDEAERCHRVAFLHRGRLMRTAAPEELKRGLPGRLLELHTPVQDEALKILRGLAEVSWVNRFGLGLHVLLAEGAEVEAVATRLERAGVKTQSLSQIAPSLEDAYIHYVASGEDVGWL